MKPCQDECLSQKVNSQEEITATTIQKPEVTTVDIFDFILKRQLGTKGADSVKFFQNLVRLEFVRKERKKSMSSKDRQTL